MTDPYVVLGVSPSASDDEVKAAYRKLAKKYHPDNYADNPLADLASEKMVEINEAYDKVMNMRRNGNKSGSGSSSGSYSSYNSSSGYSEFADVRRLINANRLDDAEQILDGVQSSSRNAEWNFLKGYILYKRGWLDEATNYFERACNLDPSNAEYRNAYEQLNAQRSGAFGGYKRSNMSASTLCDLCSALWCADCCCECFGGDLIPCC